MRHLPVLRGAFAVVRTRVVQQQARCLTASAATADSKLLPADPGTVQEYDQHLFLEVPGQTAADWPSKAEALPHLLHAFGAIAKHKHRITGSVKVTAITKDTESSPSRATDGTCNALLFPAGVGLIGIRPGDFEAVVTTHLLDQPEGRPHSAVVEELQGLHLFVCTHGTRDSRCGSIGPQLVRRLRFLIKERGFSQDMHVYECSHVGGHKYAGNVLVFGAISPNDGDWFGGVMPSDAEDFFTALTEIELGSEGGFDNPVLRQFWRGRMGMTKDQQREAFQHGTCECGSGEEEEEGNDGDLEALLGQRLESGLRS